MTIRYHVFSRHDGKDQPAGFLNDSRFGKFQSWTGQPGANHVEHLMHDNEGRWYCLFKQRNPSLEPASAPGDPEVFIDADSHVMVYSPAEAREWFKRNGRDIPAILAVTGSSTNQRLTGDARKSQADNDTKPRPVAGFREIQRWLDTEFFPANRTYFESESEGYPAWNAGNKAAIDKGKDRFSSTQLALKYRPDACADELETIRKQIEKTDTYVKWIRPPLKNGRDPVGYTRLTPIRISREVADIIDRIGGDDND